jgi:predicted SnoaL-like aldol condensation-catalyzing enzyme
MKTIQLDRSVLHNLYGDCTESMIELFTDFITSYSETRQSLFSAFESGNLVSLKRVLHFHGPSFMYLGVPEVAAMFKSLEAKCSEVDNHFALSADFADLMQTMERSCLQAKNEMEYLKKAS